jgi:hypothetical protein
MLRKKYRGYKIQPNNTEFTNSVMHMTVFLLEDCNFISNVLFFGNKYVEVCR